MLHREDKRKKSKAAIEKRWAKQREKYTDVSTDEHTDVIPNKGKERKGKEKKETKKITKKKY